MVATAQRLLAEGLPMIEFAQTVGNLTAASSNLYELVKGRNLIVYGDPELRLAIQRSVAIETFRAAGGSPRTRRRTISTWWWRWRRRHWGRSRMRRSRGRW
jgi:hypothetical protein